MNKLKWITSAVACVMVVLAALGSLCGAAVTLCTNEFTYGGMSRMAVMSELGAQDAADAYIGLTQAQQDVFAKEIVSFMKGETDAQPAVLGEKEQQHMLDVRDLVQLAQRVSQGCMGIAAGLAVVIAWTGAKEKRRGMPAGTLVGTLIVAAAAVGVYMLLNTQGFEAMFYRFHEIFFTNDLWLMNPETDILIRMMPQQFFERAGMELVHLALRSFMITWILLCAVYLIIGGMIRRQLAQEKGSK